jgi:hypothetical protein
MAWLLPPLPPLHQPTAAPRTFRCRDNGVSLWGPELPRVKLNLKNNRTTNIQQCLKLCSSNPICDGFLFRVGGSWGEACKLGTGC